MVGAAMLRAAIGRRHGSVVTSVRIAAEPVFVIRDHRRSASCGRGGSDSPPAAVGGGSGTAGEGTGTVDGGDDEVPVAEAGTAIGIAVGAGSAAGIAETAATAAATTHTATSTAQRAQQMSTRPA